MTKNIFVVSQKGGSIQACLEKKRATSFNSGQKSPKMRHCISAHACLLKLNWGRILASKVHLSFFWFCHLPLGEFICVFVSRWKKHSLTVYCWEICPLKARGENSDKFDNHAWIA